MNTSNFTGECPATSSANSAQPDALALILERLEAIESKLGTPPATKTTRAGRIYLTDSEYEEKYGVPRQTMAVALVMCGETVIQNIADRLFVHRVTLTKGSSFKTFRKYLGVLQSGNGVLSITDEDLRSHDDE